MNATDSPRRPVYLLLIVVATAMALGRVLGVVLVYEPDIHRPENAGPDDLRRIWPKTRPEPMPTFGSNDRSRWATVRSLVDEGTFVIGTRDRDYKLRAAILPLAAADGFQLLVLLRVGTDYRDRLRGDSGIVFEDGYQTVDKVLHPDRLEYYSSKPPLLTTLVAGEYWLLKKSFHWTMKDQPWEVVRTILVTINVLPFALYLWLMSRLLKHYGETDWGRLYIMAAACFGTLVTPFLTTLNNHTVAVVSTTIALYATMRIWCERDPHKSLALWYALAGLSAGFTVANELPAAAFAAGLFFILLTRSWNRTMLWFVPLAILPLAALLLTNYLAFGKLGVSGAYGEFGGPWYEYEGSHWLVPKGGKRGIDFAGRNGETKAWYSIHLLVGHHGVFSLTPLFLLTTAALVAGLWPKGGDPQARSGPEGNLERLPYFLYPFCLVLSIIVIGFYIVKSDNYGGWTSGPRWLLWLTPLWLLMALPAADWLGRRRWGRIVACVLLVLGVVSASYPAWNPWRHPWIYRFFEARGWIPY